MITTIERYDFFLDATATGLLRDRRGIDLAIDNQEAQDTGATLLERPRSTVDRADVPALQRRR